MVNLKQMHTPNNRTLYICDNLRVLRGINSGCIDLIATDPPFNTKRQFNAPLGSKAAGQKFDDRWRWDEVTDEWHDLIATDYPAIKELIEAAVVIEGGTVNRNGEIDTGRVTNSLAAFLVWMAPRLIEMQRVLKPAGSIYLHCDPTASHFLKLLMDSIFGKNNFRNEVIWLRYSGRSKGSQHTPKSYGVHNDSLLFYAASPITKMVHPYRELTKDEIDERYPKIDAQGRRYTGIAHFRGRNMGERPNLCYTWRGFTNPHPSGWRLSKERIEQEYQDGKVVIHENGRLERRRFYDPEKGVSLGNVWTDIQPPKKKESTGWSTQKPLELYERIIKASSNKGDLVLDPFAGCATTCVAAETLERKWVGIDIDPVAEQVTKERLYNVSGLSQQIDDEFVTVLKHPPRRTDIPIITQSKMRLMLWKKQGRRCANYYCSLNQNNHEIRKEDVHLDHIIPKSRGGTDDLENRIALCGNCNMRKSSKAWGEFLDKERAKQPHPKVAYG